MMCYIVSSTAQLSVFLHNNFNTSLTRTFMESSELNYFHSEIKLCTFFFLLAIINQHLMYDMDTNVLFMLWEFQNFILFQKYSCHKL